MYRVALLGIDGCGKSTILEKMKGDETFQNCRFLWMRWKPYFLRPLYKLLNKGKYEAIREQSELNTDYKKKSSLKKKLFRNPLIRNIWLKLAVWDYRFTFRKQIKGIKKEENIVFDRYFYDLFIDQGLNFGYSKEKIYELICKNEKKFFPLDKVLYIRIRPETGFSRKKDIPNMEYLNKRFEVYEYLAERMGWQAIDAEKSLEEEYMDICRIIKEA